MIDIFGRLIRLPIEMLIFSVEMFGQTMRGMQDIADRSLTEVLAEGVEPSPDVTSSGYPEAARPEPVREAEASYQEAESLPLPAPVSAGPATPSPVAPPVPAQSFAAPEALSQVEPPRHVHNPFNQGPPTIGGPPQAEERRIMADTNLSDDMVKLVEYSIVSIQREKERRLYSGEQIVTENLTGEAFASWMITQYLQSEGYASQVAEDASNTIRERDRKYLRVFYNVLDRWPEQSLDYEEKQLDILKDIAEALGKDN